MRPRLLWMALALSLSLFSHHSAAAEEAGAPPQDNSDWHFVGPSQAARESEGVTIGRINAIAFDPVEPSTLYAGTPASGLWRTEDDGATWELLTGSLPRLGITDIAVDPHDNKTIYILTGDGEYGYKADPPSIGVKKSTDGGHTWQSTGLTFKPEDHRWGHRLIMDPTNPSILLAAMESGLHRTKDGGKTWRLVLGPNGEFFDVQFHPSDPSIVYAATGTNVYRSVDEGQSWDQLSGGLPQKMEEDPRNRIRLAVTPASPDTLYVLYGVKSGFTVGLYRSDDRGNTFTKRSSTDPLPTDPNAPPPIDLTKPNILGHFRGLFGSQSSYDLAMAVSPSNVDRVHVGGIDTWRSDDGGKTWTSTSRWTLPKHDPNYTHADIHTLIYRYPRIEPSSGDVLYTGTDGGVFRSENGGDSWTNIANIESGISSLQVYSVCGTPQDPKVLYFGSQDNGTWRLTLDAEGKNVQAKEVAGGDGMVCQVNPKYSKIVYAGHQRGWLSRSDDGGKTFPWGIYPPLPLLRGEVQWLVPYVLAPDDPGTIYLCSTDLWRSHEYFLRWENLTNGAIGSSVACTQVAVSPAAPKTIYIAKAALSWERPMPPLLGGGGVFRSTDGGITWQSITGNLPVTEADISSLAVSPTDPRRIWVTFAHRGSPPRAKVFGSVDGGATWTDLSAGLPELSVRTVTAEDSPLNGIYVGTDDGVYYRDDKLSKFVPFKHGLPSGQVTSLLIDQNKHRLFAATFVQGIWRTAIPCHENCSTGPVNPAPQ